MCRQMVLKYRLNFTAIFRTFLSISNFWLFCEQICHLVTHSMKLEILRWLCTENWMIMWENVAPETFKDQIWIQRNIPQISMYFEFLVVLWAVMRPRYPFNEIGNIEMVGYLKLHDDVGKCVSLGFKGQNWIQSIVPLISLYFQLLIVSWTDMSPRYQVNEIGNIEMVGT